MDREEAAKELMAMLEEAQEGPYYSEEEVRAHLLEILAPRNQVYMTGDTHGQFERVIEFCARREVEPENTFVILGDAGLNYYNDRRDRKKKDQLAQVPITFFCLHGNHEMRPSEELGYEVAEYHGGKVWMQPAYPNILFAIDGEVYDFNGNSCIVIGGAYSVDKYYRLARGWSWFPDEQPSEEIKAKVERVLAERNWKIDIVLSHTGPLKYEPTEVFLPMIDQSTVDKSIGWWLYEAPDAGYTVSWEEAGKEVSVDLTEAGALYVKKSGCEFLIYKQNDDNLNRNQRKIEYNKTNTQK